MSSLSMCNSKLQHVKDLLGANSGRHLLLHLTSSIAHVTISLVLMFFWMNAYVDSSTGNAIVFGVLSIIYSVISSAQLGIAVAHYYFAPRSQKTLAVTILATSGASAVVAGAGIVVIMIIARATYSDYYDTALFVCTLVFLGGSIVMNSLLFIISLFNWRHQSTIEQSLKDSRCNRLNAKVISKSTSSNYAAWENEAVQYDEIELNELPKSAPATPPKIALVPPSAPLYPSHQLGSITSFESLRELTANAKNTASTHA